MFPKAVWGGSFYWRIFAALADAGRFRADLLDRLSFEVITLPPLRAREGDIEVLATYFGQRMAAVLGWDEWPGFGPRALAAMEGHDWPGNVRELRNVADRFVLGVLGRTFNGGTGLADIVPLADQVDGFERGLILHHLRRCDGNVGAAAEALSVPKKTLYDKIRRYGLVPGSFR